MATSQKYAQAVNASPQQVYRSFTNATALREWLCDTATLNPRSGGHVFLSWNNGYYACGEFLKLQENKEVALTWKGRDDPTPSKVRVLITPMDNGMTSFTLEHFDLKEDGEWAAPFKEISRGWSNAINNLLSVLENGPDLRITNRPMLGISFGEFDERRAVELNVPIRAGLRVDSVVEGMGAQAVGIQRNDIIFSLNGKPVSNHAEIISALEHFQAGNPVELGFYRNGEKKKLKMELSRRPIPQIPSTALGLGTMLREQSASLQKRISRLLQTWSPSGSTSNSPSEEWGAREILAHLIHVERDGQSYIQELVHNQEKLSDEPAANLQARIQATVCAYSSAEKLLEELTVNQAETIFLVEHLPETFVAQKGSFWKVGYRLAENYFHAQEHEAQLAAAVSASRR